MGKKICERDGKAIYGVVVTQKEYGTNRTMFFHGHPQDLKFFAHPNCYDFYIKEKSNGGK